MVNNLAHVLEHGGGSGDTPEVNYLALTDDEIIYLLSVVEGCSFADDEAMTIRNRLRVLAGISPVQLVVDNAA